MRSRNDVIAVTVRCSNLSNNGKSSLQGTVWRACVPRWNGYSVGSLPAKYRHAWLELKIEEDVILFLLRPGQIVSLPSRSAKDLAESIAKMDKVTECVVQLPTQHIFIATQTSPTAGSGPVDCVVEEKDFDEDQWPQIASSHTAGLLHIQGTMSLPQEAVVYLGYITDARVTEPIWWEEFSGDDLCAQDGDILSTQSGQGKLKQAQQDRQFADVLVMKVTLGKGHPIYLCDFSVNPLQYRVPIYTRNAVRGVRLAVREKYQGLRNSISGLRLQHTSA